MLIKGTDNNELRAQSMSSIGRLSLSIGSHPALLGMHRSLHIDIYIYVCVCMYVCVCVWESNRYHPFLHLSGRVNELSAVVRKNLSKNVSKKEVLQCISDMVVGVGIVSSL